MEERAMKSKGLFLACLYVAFFFAAILTSTNQVVPVQAATPTVSLVPSLVSTSPGQNFTVGITVSTILDLYAWEFTLRWNAALLDAENAVEGPFLKSGGRSTFLTYNINSTDGQMVADCTVLGMIPGVNGNGVLSTVTFSAKNIGECPLDLNNVSLIDSSENTIPCQTVDGYCRAISIHDIAVTHVDASPTVTLPGNAVGINVTTQNKGGFDEVFNVTVHINSTLIGFQQVTLSNSSSTTVPFTWDTTGYAKGDYIVAASAGPVNGETYTTDNTMIANDPVTILTAGHDVAVTSIKPEKTIAGQGYSIRITIKICNFGNYSETTDVTAYLNANVFGNQQAFLASGAKTDLLFVNDTSQMLRGNYSVSVTVSPVPGETLTGDNTLVEGWVVITIPGDVDGNRSVNILDAILLSAGFNSSPGSPNWNSNADINGDNGVNILDAILLSINFGK